MSLKAGSRVHPRKKPTQARAQETVRAVVEATEQVLRQVGVQGLSTNLVAERAGVSIGSLYQYFPSKEALVAAVVTAQLDRDIAVVDGQFAALPATYSEAVTHFCEGMCAHQAHVAPLLKELLPWLSVVDQEVVVQRTMQAFVGRMEGLFEHYGDELDPLLHDPAHRRAAARVAIHALRGVLNALAVEEPEALSSPAIRHELERLLGCYLRRRTTS